MGRAALVEEVGDEEKRRLVPQHGAGSPRETVMPPPLLLWLIPLCRCAQTSILQWLPTAKLIWLCHAETSIFSYRCNRLTHKEQIAADHRGQQDKLQEAATVCGHSPLPLFSRAQESELPSRITIKGLKMHRYNNFSLSIQENNQTMSTQKQQHSHGPSSSSCRNFLTATPTCEHKCLCKNIQSNCVCSGERLGITSEAIRRGLAVSIRLPPLYEHTSHAATRNRAYFTY